MGQQQTGIFPASRKVLTYTVQIIRTFLFPSAFCIIARQCAYQFTDCGQNLFCSPHTVNASIVAFLVLCACRIAFGYVVAFNRIGRIYKNPSLLFFYEGKITQCRNHRESAAAIAENCRNLRNYAAGCCLDRSEKATIT